MSTNSSIQSFEDLLNKRIQDAKEDQIALMPKKFFGEIQIIGNEYRQAAQYYKEEIIKCDSKLAELMLNIRLTEKFDVAIRNCQSRPQFEKT